MLNLEIYFWWISLWWTDTTAGLSNSLEIQHQQSATTDPELTKSPVALNLDLQHVTVHRHRSRMQVRGEENVRNTRTVQRERATQLRGTEGEWIHTSLRCLGDLYHVLTLTPGGDKWNTSAPFILLNQSFLSLWLIPELCYSHRLLQALNSYSSHHNREMSTHTFHRKQRSELRPVSFTALLSEVWYVSWTLVHQAAWHL